MRKERPKIVVAVKVFRGTNIQPGQVLGEEFRKPEHAFHAIPQLVKKHMINPVSIGVFCDGQHVPQLQAQVG
jgi:hypothetical protein